MDEQFEKEKQRRLSPQEKRRLARFEEVCAELASRGYARTDLTVGIVRANVVTLALSVPLFVICIVAFVLVHRETSIVISLSTPPIMLAVLVALTVVHELIHGLTWSFFAENRFKDIEFGFMKEYLTPYCTCSTPLPLAGYIVGGLMPGIVLGVIPTIIALISGSLLLLLIGLFMIMGAGGDMLITFELLRYRSHAAEKLIYDHPTQAGCVVFER